MLATLGIAIAGALLSTIAGAVEATQGEPQSVSQGKTRAQVKAELAEAVRTGDISSARAGVNLNQLNPSRYPPKAPVAGKTRDDVKVSFETLSPPEAKTSAAVAAVRSAVQEAWA